jgi:CRP-like cAMP-binding protein
MGPGAFFGERALLQQSVVRPASMVAKGQTLLLSLTRRRFEECLGPLSALTAAHGAWQQWLGGQGELMHRNSPGPKFAELIAVSWAWPCRVLCEGEECVCICWGISSGGGQHRG